LIFIPIQECQLDGRDGYQFGPEGKCYTHDGTDEGREAAKTKAEEQGQAIEASKHANSSPLSYEYLKAVYDRIMAHPSIWDVIKNEIRVQARASAGGTLKAKYSKEFNNAEVAGDITETDDYIDVPTVFCKAGVFTGSNGIPTLKKYESLKASAPWMLGTPITPEHIQTDTVRPTDRRLGHIVSAKARDETQDLFGISRFFKQNLNDDELQKIRNRQFPGGSPGYFTPIEHETGEFDGKQYQAVETGPYVFGEYAVFFDGTRAACEREDGCGPYMNSAPTNVAEDNDDVLSLFVKKCHRKITNLFGDIDMTPEEFTKLLNEAVGPAVKAAIGDIPARIEALEKQKNEAPAPVLTDIPEFKSLVETVKQLNSALPDIQSIKAEQEAAKDMKAKTAFGKLLNAAALGEIDKIWNEAKTDPLSYLDANPDKRLGSIKETQFTGKILNADGSEFDLAAEQAKLYKY